MSSSEFQSHLLPISCPAPDAAVLGNQHQNASLVLGGLEGVEWRLMNPAVKYRISALPELFNYGKPGLERLIQALQDEFGEVEEAAYKLLKPLSGSHLNVRPALLEDYIPLQTKNSKKNGKNFLPLRNYSGAGNWQEANQETLKLMFRLDPLNEKSWFDLDSLKTFNCKDLQIIDRLWVRHSKGRFGFSVQGQIWQKLLQQYNNQNSRSEYYISRKEIWDRFGEQTGWRVDHHWLLPDQVCFNLEQPIGFLPIGVFNSKNHTGLCMFLWTTLFARIATCYY